MKDSFFFNCLPTLIIIIIMNVLPLRNKTLSGLSIKVTFARILLCSFHSVIEEFSLHISSRVILKDLIHEDCSGLYCDNIGPGGFQNSPRAGLQGSLDSGSGGPP